MPNLSYEFLNPAENGIAWKSIMNKSPKGGLLPVQRKRPIKDKKENNKTLLSLLVSNKALKVKIGRKNVMTTRAKLD